MAAALKKRKADRKSGSVLIRVTDDERALLESAAKRESLGLSTWMRALAIKAAREILGK